jgi:pimeloyl-ACP methyl ester carboxylesterase
MRVSGGRIDNAGFGRKFHYGKKIVQNEKKNELCLWTRCLISFLLTSITQPTAVVWGEADPILPPSWADRLEDYFPYLVGVQMLAGIGHFVPFEAPDTFVEAIGTVL